MDAFVTRVKQIITDTSCPTDCIEIEVTETTSIKNIDSLFNNINEVKQLGIHIAIDDFGSGYSSLSLIRTLHQSLDKLKLDKSLIDNICNTTIDQEIVKQIIELGKVLNIDVLAEGIEYVEQQTLLLSLGCKFGQGYLFEKPLPATDIVKYLSKKTY
jgi:EAL domain-containing protein (putative c-di-GMP-specific phosphodiesterase class I)